MKAMILAAGRGERLRPLTASIPKPLIDVGGESLLERHLRRLRGAGFDDVVINVSHLGDQIERRCGDGARLGMSVSYSREAEGPLETAGGILAALPLLGQAPFLVVNADIWTDYPFERLRLRPQFAHLVLVPNPPHHTAGDFDLDGQVLVHGVGHACTYSGIGVFNPALFAGVAPGRRPLAPLLFEYAARAALSGEIFRGRWFDIGTMDRLEEARRAVAG
ncbi:MAG: nucleotidyltransferase family protein [Gammaproteobacteria bacterium]